MTGRETMHINLLNKKTIDVVVRFKPPYDTGETDKYDDMLDTITDYHNELGVFPPVGTLLWCETKELFYTVDAVQYLPINKGKGRNRPRIVFLMNF